MIEGRNVLVTGGAGFIGSHLAEKLASGCMVTVLDNLSTGKKKNLPGNAISHRRERICAKFSGEPKI